MHTVAGCYAANSTINVTATGDMTFNNCDYTVAANHGCTFQDMRNSSYGADFAAGGGGIYAAEFSSDAVSVWFFPVRSASRSSILLSLTFRFFSEPRSLPTSAPSTAPPIPQAGASRWRTTRRRPATSTSISRRSRSQLTSLSAETVRFAFSHLHSSHPHALVCTHRGGSTGRLLAHMRHGQLRRLHRRPLALRHSLLRDRLRPDLRRRAQHALERRRAGRFGRHWCDRRVGERDFERGRSAVEDESRSGGSCWRRSSRVGACWRRTRHGTIERRCCVGRALHVCLLSLAPPPSQSLRLLRCARRKASNHCSLSLKRSRSISSATPPRTVHPNAITETARAKRQQTTTYTRGRPLSDLRDGVAVCARVRTASPGAPGQLLDDLRARKGSAPSRAGKRREREVRLTCPRPNMARSWPVNNSIS